MQKIFTILVLLLIVGCSSVPSLLYKIDVQQGNVITREMVEKLKPGMTRSQVRFVLGSALVDDIFHKDRWDYVYRLVQQGVLIEEYKLTVFFENDRLAKTQGDFSDSFASVSPKLAEPIKYPRDEKQNTEFLPEPAVQSAEQEKPRMLAIEEKNDETSSPEPTVSDKEQTLPPPPPGIEDSIEAD